MNALRLLTTLIVLITAALPAAPGDQIDPKEFKDTVSLTLGTQGTIQFKQDGDTLTSPTLLKDADKKLPGIKVEFKQQPQFLSLNLKNDLPKALRYRAAIRMKGRKDYHETSLIVPVTAGIFSFETWRDPIEEIILFDFKLTDEKL